MNPNTRIAQLLEWDAAYEADDPAVSNEVYDAYREETRRLFPQEQYFRKVGAPGVRQKHRHTVPMGSLEKLWSIDEFRVWYRNVGSPALSLSSKADGISVSLRYENGFFVRAVTRGDGVFGEDITQNVAQMAGVPKTLRRNITCHVRGEIIVQKTRLAALEELTGRKYKTLRNAAGGVAKRLDGIGCSALTVLSYELLPDACLPAAAKIDEFKALDELGFWTPYWRLLCEASHIETCYSWFIREYRAEIDYEIDGLVLQVDSQELRSTVGVAGARALKFPADEAETTVHACPWQVGASGHITPVAYFDPVVLCGASVAQANLHNLATLAKIAAPADRPYLCDGDVVLVSRRGDVIPHIERLVRATPPSRNASGAVPIEFWPPAACPACGQPTRRIGAFLVCENRLNCEAQTVGAIKRWLKKIDVKDFGGALIETLCIQGVLRTPSDLYSLTEQQLANTLINGRRYGESAARTSITNLRSRMALPRHVIIGSLGIPLWSRTSCKQLTDVYMLPQLRWLTREMLENIHGVGPIKARAFEAGIAEKWPEIERLFAAGIRIEQPRTPDGSLQGVSFCFTKIRSAELSTAIEAAGGVVKNSVTRGLTYLIVKSKQISSDKLTKAQAAGVRVIEMDEAWQIVRGVVNSQRGVK